MLYLSNPLELVNKGKYIKDIEEYYGMKQNSYNIILCPTSIGGGFAGKVKKEDGTFDIYSIQGTWEIFLVND